MNFPHVWNTALSPYLYIFWIMGLCFIKNSSLRWFELPILSLLFTPALLFPNLGAVTFLSATSSVLSNTMRIFSYWIKAQHISSCRSEVIQIFADLPSSISIMPRTASDLQFRDSYSLHRDATNCHFQFRIIVKFLWSIEKCIVLCENQFDCVLKPLFYPGLQMLFSQSTRSDRSTI